MGIRSPRDIEDRVGPSVVVVEAARHMQILFRSMLSGTGTKSLRIYSDPNDAISSVVSDPPDVLLVDWESEKLPGEKFLREFRNQRHYPVCLLPVIMVMSQVSQQSFETAIRMGAHAVISKPVSGTRLFDYISWVSREEQKMTLDGQKYVVSSLVDRLDPANRNINEFDSSQMIHERHIAEVESIQSDVDRILKSSFY